MTAITLVEQLKSITDLIFGIEGVVFAVVCFCSAGGVFAKERRGWGFEFLAVAAAAFLGYYLHGFHVEYGIHVGLWFVLFIIMFSITLGIYLLLIPHLGNESFVCDGETKLLKYAFPVLLVLTEALHLLDSHFDIYVYALYAILLAVSLTRKTICGGRKDPRFLLTVLLMVLAAVSQGFKFVFSEYAVVAAHCFLIGSLALLFDFALHITAPVHESDEASGTAQRVNSQ